VLFYGVLGRNKEMVMSLKNAIRTVGAAGLALSLAAGAAAARDLTIVS
jgi:hypothetical protein